MAEIETNMDSSTTIETNANSSPVLIRIHLTDSYAASTTLKITSTTLAEEVCTVIGNKLGLSEQDKIFGTLICVINGYDGKTSLHWMKTLKNTDIILSFQTSMLQKRVQLLKRDVDLINSLSISWYYKDIRSVPLNLDGDLTGNSSSDEEDEISLNDLMYLGSGDRRAILYKRSNKDHNLWRKRLCILNDKLWCVNVKKKSPYATCIQLNGKIMSQDEAPDLNYPNGIIIQIPNQTTYFLRTSSLAEQHIWQEELQDRAAYGLENSVLFMGEMIICDEEYARGQKKQNITMGSLRREAIWKSLKASAQILEAVTATATATAVTTDVAQGKASSLAETTAVYDKSRTSSIGNPIIEEHMYMNGSGSRRSECSVDEDPGLGLDPLTPTIISYGLTEDLENLVNQEEGDSNQQQTLNADQAFLPRDPQARMDAYIKYRSSYPASSTHSSRSRPVSRRISALRNTSTSSPSPSSSSPQNIKTSSMEEFVFINGGEEYLPTPLSALPSSPIHVIHSFHCHSPHIAAAFTLFDAIHDFKSAFRHDLHLNPRTLWCLALKIYYNHFHRFIHLSQNTSSRWAIVINYLPLHPHLQSPSTSTTTTATVTETTSNSSSSSASASAPSSPSKTLHHNHYHHHLHLTTNNDQQLTLKENHILQIFERLQASFLSNLQQEVLPVKKTIKKKSAEQSSYWFWPSVESEESSLFNKEDKKNEFDEAKQRSLVSVGYGLQLISPHRRPQITLFDELLAEDSLLME